MKHFIHPYLKSPLHPVTINVIGVGGTGSHLLTKLALLDQALRAHDHMGIHVTAFDSKAVSPHNIGRQNYFEGDIGLNKAEVLIGRINRVFGTHWDAINTDYTKENVMGNNLGCANITISCVDTVSARREIADILAIHSNDFRNDHAGQGLYWIDCGNARDFGQIILGTNAIQPVNNSEEKDLAYKLPDILMVHPDMEKYDVSDIQGESCSLRESLLQQSLVINPMIADFTLKLVHDLFFNFFLDYHGFYINLSTNNIAEIKVSHTSNILYNSIRKKRVNKARAILRKQEI